MTIPKNEFAPASRHRADLQGLRALAIVLVLASHVGVPGLVGGYVGVDVFFVLSGYLITSHLLRSLAETGRVDFAAFYLRRARRILPAALLVAVVTVALGLLVLPPLALGALGRMFASVVFFGGNVVLAVDGTDYLRDPNPSAFQQFWSLGVEEQFYLIFPLVLWLLWRLVGGRSRLLALGIVVLSLVSLTTAEWVIGFRPSWGFFLLPPRAWEFGVGAVVAVVLHRCSGRRPAPSRWLTRTASFGVVGGVVAIVACAVAYDDATRFPGLGALPAVLGSAIVIVSGAVARDRTPLSSRPAQVVGDLSYSLYLWHWPLLILPVALLREGHEMPVWAKAASVMVAVVLAALTRRYVELPFLRAGRPRRQGTAERRFGFVRMAAAVSVVVIVLAAGVVPALVQKNAPRSTGVALSAAAPMRPPLFADHVAPNLSPSLTEAGDSTSVAHRNGCHVGTAEGVAVNDCVFGDTTASTTVAVFGDSHAAHWVPAVDDWGVRSGVRVRAWTKVGCPSVLVTMTERGVEKNACSDWRRAVLERLATERPDVVLLSNAYGLPFATDGSSRRQRWAEAAAEVVAELSPSSRVVVVANTPKLSGSAPTCLSGHLADPSFCGAARSEAVDQKWIDAERTAVEGSGGSYADLNDYFCTATTCGVVVGSTLLYRDQGHLTETWSRSLAQVVGRIALPG